MAFYTEEEKRQYLTQAGFNPDEYDINEYGGAVPVVNKVQPSITNKPVVSPVASSANPATSSLPAFGRAAASSVIPTAAGLAGGVGTGAAIGWLGGPFSPITVPLGGLIGGIASSYGASKLQEAVLPDSVNQQLALDQQEHPVASFAGGFVPSMVAFNPVKGIQQLPSLGRGLGKMATLNTEALTAGEKAATLNAAMNMGTSAGHNIYGQMQSDQPFNPLELAAHTAMGAIMNEPTRMGKSMGFHSAMDIDAVNAAKAKLVTDEAAKLRESQQVSPYGNAVPPPSIQTPQPGIVPSVDSYGRPVSMVADKMAKYKGTVDPMETAQANMEGEGGIPQQQPDNKLTDFVLAQNELEQQRLQNVKLQTEQVKQQNEVLQKSLTENQVRITKPSLERSILENQVPSHTSGEVVAKEFGVSPFNELPVNTKPMEKANQQVASESAADLEARKLEGYKGDKYSSESAIDEPTPGTFQSVQRYGHEGDTKRTIEAIKNGNKPVGFMSEDRVDLAKKAGLLSDGNFIYRNTPEGIAKYEKAKATVAEYETDKSNPMFHAKMGEHFGYTPTEIEAFRQRMEAYKQSKAKFQSPETVPTSKPHLYDKLTWEQLPQSFKTKVLDLAKRRGISLEQARTIIDPRTGEAKLGSYTEDTRTAKVSEEIGRGDTGPHELGHGYLDDLLNSNMVSDKELANRALEIFGGDRAQAEEALVSRLGKEGHVRITEQLDGSALTKFNRFFKDFTTRTKYKLGLGSDEDVIQHLAQRQQTDAPYGMRGEIDLTRPKYAGFQKDGLTGGQKIYNLQEDVKDGEGNLLHSKGSTLSEDTLKKLGVKYSEESALDNPSTEVPKGSIAGSAEDLTAHIKSGKATTGSVLQKIAGSDSPYSELASHLFSTSSKEKLNDVVRTTLSGEDQRPAYKLSEKTSKIPENHTENMRLILHEIGHSLTSHNIPSEFSNLKGSLLRKSMDKYLVNEKSSPAIKELIESYYHAANELELNHILFGDYHEKLNNAKTLHKEHGVNGYAMSNLHEFTTMALSDKKFQIKLNELSSGLNDGKSLWSRIVESVRKILGVSVKDYSLLERTLKATDALVAEDRPKGETYSVTENKRIFDLENPDIRYSSESALDSEVTPEKRRELSIPLFKPEITKIKEHFGEEGKTVAKGFTDFYDKFNLIQGKLVNSIVGQLRKHVNYLDPKQLATNNSAKLDKVRQYMDDVADEGSSKHTLSPEEKEIESHIRDFMKLTLAEKNSRPGLPTTTANEQYFPHVMGRKQLDILLNKPGMERTKLVKDFLEYHKNKLGTENPEKALETFMAGYKNHEKNLAENFGPIDKSAGVGIPQSWRETNLIDRLSRYANRYSRRIAYHDSIESKPEMVKALEDPALGIGNSDIVRNVMDDIAGRKEHEEAKRTAVSGVIRAGMLGPITGAKDFVANLTLGLQHQTPSQSVKSLMHAWGNMKESMEGSFRSGVNRYNIASFEFGDGGIESSVNILRSTRDVLNTVQGRNLLERVTRATAFGQGKFLAMDNLQAMVNDKATSQGRSFFENFGKDVDIKKAISEKEFSPDDLDKMAARYVKSVQGAYDYTGLPAVAQRGSLAPVLSLARWNIEKMNNFVKYNIEPARRGNFTPLLMSTVGMLIGGEAVTKLVEAASGRTEKTPKLEEIIAAGKEGENVIPAAAYKLAALSSMSGYAGMLGDVVKSAMDSQFKNRVMGYHNPLVDGITNGVDIMGDLTEAVRNGDLDITSEAISKVLETYFQAYRLGLNQLGNDTKENADRSNKFRDLKVYKQLHDLPVGDTSGITPNPFLNKESREFKRGDNIEESMKLLPDLLKKAFEKSEGDPERLKAELTKLRTNNYETMPSLERTPIAFFRYLNYLKAKGGERLASDRLEDYMRQNMVNKMKSKMIPSF